MASPIVRELAPWLDDLLGSVRDVDETVREETTFTVDGLPVRVSDSNRRTGMRFVVDPSLMLPCGDAWFDVREWLDVVDGGDHSTVRGEAQVAVLDRVAEFAGLQSRETLVALRGARDRWVEAEGERALHGPGPEWPDAVESPTWMEEFDSLLIAAGFASGWRVDAGPGWPIGVVRQRGPLRVQLSVFENEPLVQVAVWPLRAWVGLPAVATHFDISTAEVAPVVLLDLAERMCDLEFGAGPRVPFDKGDRAPLREPDPVGQGTGPGDLHEFYLVSGALVDRWFEMPDYDAVRTARRLPETCRGGPQFRGTLKPGKDLTKVHPVLRTYGMERIWAESTLPTLARITPDATLFEFDVDGQRFFSSKFPSSTGAGWQLPSRSTGDRRVDPALGGMVVDPRSSGRPGHLLSSLIGDRRAIDALAEVAPTTELYPTWDPDKEFARITIRKLLSNSPDPKPEPFMVRGPLPESDRPDPERISVEVRAADGDYAVNKVFTRAVDWFASHRAWDQLEQFLSDVETRILGQEHRALIPVEAFGEFEDAAEAMFREAYEMAADEADVKAFAIGHHYDGMPDGSITIYLCDKDEDTDLDWPAYFQHFVDGPLLHDHFSPWGALCEHEPRASLLGYSLTYARLVASLGKVYDRQRHHLPVAVVDEYSAIYL